MPPGFWFGGSQVHAGKATTGDVITTFWSCLIAAKSFEDILPHWVILAKGRAAASALRSILSNMATVKALGEGVEGLVPQFCDGDIKLRGVRNLSALLVRATYKDRSPLRILRIRHRMYFENVISTFQQVKSLLSLVGVVPERAQ
jgi:hypothetical protein